ncbi:long-chain fatty acid--CoA ligase, partial [Micromonospora aurantiaca]|nr:long-chain fatty acid--CoA ligase [Micromonospora aurantiaca]
LVRGINVLRGYWNNEAATKEALEDGWFHTGDLGSLDEDGFLRITGRKKEILVTAAGKNVAPAPLEDRLRAHPLISQCLVVGDGRKFIS